MNRWPSGQSFTCFEDLSNEIIYEIFEFFDFNDIYQTFSTLNNRYYHLVHHSTLPIKLNLSSMSKSIYENYEKNILIPYQHRIHFIYLSNSLIYDLPSSPLHNLLQYPRLETLILENIESKNLENLLQQLSSLPHLSSLTLIPVDDVQNKNNLYYQIFHLPALQYCKISFKERSYIAPLRISDDQFSPIKHLILHNNCHVNHLNILLSYLPQLCRLSCHHLTDSKLVDTHLQPVVLHHLTHLSLKIEDSTFDHIELFLQNLHHQLQVFHFSTTYAMSCLNAHRWQQLILSYLPNLRLFDIRLSPSYNPNQQVFFISIQQFMTSFWCERKWFFRYEWENSFAAFYSVKLHKTDYILNDCQYQDTYPCPNTIDLHSVHHISIGGNLVTKPASMYFPNVTNLTLLNYSNRSLHSISTILDRLIPLTKLSQLIIHCHHLCISQLLDLFYFSPHIQILILKNSISFSKISLISIQQTQTFQTIFHQNQLKEIRFQEDASAESVRLFSTLCPRLKHMIFDLNQYDPFIIRKLITDGLYYPYVPFLCFLNIGNVSQRRLHSCFSADCSIKLTSQHLYVWS